MLKIIWILCNLVNETRLVGVNGASDIFHYFMSDCIEKLNVGHLGLALREVFTSNLFP